MQYIKFTHAATETTYSYSLFLQPPPLQFFLEKQAITHHTRTETNGCEHNKNDIAALAPGPLLPVTRDQLSRAPYYNTYTTRQPSKSRPYHVIHYSEKKDAT